ISGYAGRSSRTAGCPGGSHRGDCRFGQGLSWLAVMKKPAVAWQPVFDFSLKPGSDGEAGSTAARRGGVRIADLERLSHQVIDEIDFRTVHIGNRNRIDQHLGAELFDNDVVVSLLIDQIVLIGEAGTPAAFD